MGRAVAWGLLGYMAVARTNSLEPEWLDIDWIGGFNQLRTEFNRPTASHVSLFATALGCYEAYINGEKLGPGLLEPGFSTVPSHRLLYNEYDITPLLVDGPNVIGARLGSCKYGWMQTYCADSPAKCLGLKLQVLSVDDGSRLLWTNASTWHGSLSPWAPDDHAYPLRTLWDGARYNHSLEQRAWSSAGSGFTWEPAVRIEPPIDPTFFDRSTIPPIVKHPVQGIKPVDFWSPGPGIFVADFGFNMAGYCTISLPSSVSTAAFEFNVTALHGEILVGPEGLVQNQYEVPPHSAHDCAHYGSCAYQTDIYTLSTEHDAIVLEPAFTYHGFRFVEVRVNGADMNITADQLRAYFLHTDVERTGHFNSSHELLNELQEVIVRSVLGNLHSIPSDCPSREKRGWMGDAQWSAMNNMVNFDMGAVYTNYARTIMDTQVVGCTHASKDAPPPDYCLNKPLDQTEPGFLRAARSLTVAESRPPCYLCCDAAVSAAQRFGCYNEQGLAGQSFEDVAGAVPGVVPFDNVAGWPADPAWGAAVIVIPHSVWKTTGDKAAAAAAYPGMVRYAEFLLSHLGEDDLVRFGMLGDWNSLNDNGSPETKRLHPGRTPIPQVSAFYGALCLGMLAEIGRDLGGTHAEDAERYGKIAEEMKRTYHAAFYRNSTGSYGEECSQTANILPVVLGTVPKSEESRVWAALNASLYCLVNSTAPSITAGSVGTRYIFEALVKLGKEDVALGIALKETFPSFGWMVRQGPGTLWEQWEGDEFNAGTSSKNHHMFGGGIGLFLYESVAGIALQSQEVDVSRQARGLVVKPLLPIMQRLGSASASMRLPLAGAGSTVVASWAYAELNDDAELLSGPLASLASSSDLVWHINVSVSADHPGQAFGVALRVSVPLGGEALGACAQAVLWHNRSRKAELLWVSEGSQLQTRDSAGLSARASVDDAGRKELVVEILSTEHILDQPSSGHAKTLRFSAIASHCLVA